MVGGRYGLAENGLKWPEIRKGLVTHGGCRRRFAGPIRARPAAVGGKLYRRDRPEVVLTPVWRVLQVDGR